MLKIWEGLRSKADKDNDGQVGRNFVILMRTMIAVPVRLELSSLDPKNIYEYYEDVRFFFPSSALFLFSNCAATLNTNNYKNYCYKLYFPTAQKARAYLLSALLTLFY